LCVGFGERLIAGNVARFGGFMGEQIDNYRMAAVLGIGELNKRDSVAVDRGRIVPEHFAA
jgi:hypothetical protein